METEQTAGTPLNRTEPEEPQPCKAALIAALEQNWEHARHEENMRLTYFTFYWIAFASAIAFAVEKGENKGLTGLADFWLVFLFLGFISIFTLYTVIKGNEEFRNHVRAIQWIAEKVGLNGPVGDGTQPDVMFKGFMALPLPLPIRVHEFFKYLMYMTTVATWSIASAGFMMRVASIRKEFAIPLAILISASLCRYLHTRVMQAEAATQRILTEREPPGIQIRYPRK